MYEYLEEHAYISKNKKSNYQFELSKERAECIANKHNSLCEEKDKEIERLNKELEMEVQFAKVLMENNIKLKSIIKEVREYIRNNSENFDGDLCIGDYFELKDILEILDKGVKNSD